MKTLRIIQDVIAICVVLAVSGHRALAGGFEAGEQSARSTGMGGAFVAMHGDPTSLHLNPAALSYLSGTHFSFGATVMLPEDRFTGVTPDEVEWRSEAQVDFPPNLCITHTLSKGLGMGISVYVPYSNKAEWNPDWVGKRLVTKTETRVVMVTPALSMKSGDIIALGIGLCIAFPKMLYEQRIPLSDPNPNNSITDGYATYDAIGSPGWGFQVGILVEPIEAVMVGASYRSPIRFDLDKSQIRYRNIPAQLSTAYADAGFETSMLLPDKFQAGVEWRPFSWICVTADVEETHWALLQMIGLNPFEPSGLQRSLDMHWRNSTGASVGLEVSMSDISLRGGIRWEESPIPAEWLSPGFLDANGMMYSVGLGYRVAEELALDFAYAAQKYDDRLVNTSALDYDGSGRGFNGRYNLRTTSIALNVSYFWK